MSPQPTPSNPSEVMVIRQLTPNITTLSVPFTRAGRLNFGGRGTLIRLSTGALAIFSPVALTPEVKETITSLGGNLRYIIAPDMEHHVFISTWAAAYPDAILVGPAGLPEKRAKTAQSGSNPMVKDDKFTVVFDAATKRDTRIGGDFDADLDYEFVDGHVNKELVLFHRQDRVLIQADLVFNLPAKEQYSRVADMSQYPNPKSLLNRMFQALATTEGDLKWSRRMQWYLQSAGNRPSFNESIRRIVDWDFVTVIPCHGDTIEGDGKELFKRLMEWHLSATEKKV